MDLSTEWISNFEMVDDNYKNFYKEKVQIVKLYCLYIDCSNQLFHIKKDNLSINESIISKSTLISILKKHRTHKNKLFTPMSIIKYNVTLEPNDIHEYIQQPDKFNYLNAKKAIEDISWQDTILFLSNINSLYIVFQEKWKRGNSTTKKIFIRSKKLNRRNTKKKKLKHTTD